MVSKKFFLPDARRHKRRLAMMANCLYVGNAVDDLTMMRKRMRRLMLMMMKENFFQLHFV